MEPTQPTPDQPSPAPWPDGAIARYFNQADAPVDIYYANASLRAACAGERCKWAFAHSIDLAHDDTDDDRDRKIVAALPAVQELAGAHADTCRAPAVRMSEQQPTSLRNLLTTMADLLSHNTPEDEFTDGERLAMARDLTAGEEPTHTRLLAYAPRIEQPVTRGEYALRLRRIAPIPELHAQAADDYRRYADRRQGGTT